MGLRDTMDGSQELYCMACNACCVAMSPKAACFDRVSGEEIPGGRTLPEGATMLGVRLRPYQVDPRFKRVVGGAVNGVRLPDGQIIQITEYPGVCSEECANKLDSSWVRNDAVPNPWPVSARDAR
jgi:hypothetical protein